MINDINSNKTIYQLFEKFATNFSTFLNCVKIGEIISFDKNDQTCSVRVLHKQTNQYNPYVNELIEYPVLEKVPCVVLGGGGTYITHPISKGDQCVLLFSDYMIDGWWSSGEARPSDFPRKHDLSDAIAIVGLKALPNAIQDYSDFLKLAYDFLNYIEIRNNSIKLQTNTVQCSNDLNVSRNITASSVDAELHDKRGVSGVFSDTGVGSSGLSITIEDGIITAIT